MLTGDPPNVDGARETMRRTMRDGNRASEVITRLRSLFSKREAAAESVDLNESTREVIALSLGELQKSRVIVRTELADDLPLVTGDRVQLQQVVLNLLLNALEAMNSVKDQSEAVGRSEPNDGRAIVCAYPCKILESASSLTPWTSFSKPSTQPSMTAWEWVCP